LARRGSDRGLRGRGELNEALGTGKKAGGPSEVHASPEGRSYGNSGKPMLTEPMPRNGRSSCNPGTEARKTSKKNLAGGKREGKGRKSLKLR